MTPTIRQALHELADQLPDDCDWDDAMYQLYVRQKIDAGLTDVAEGRLLAEEEVFREFADDALTLSVGSGHRQRR